MLAALARQYGQYDLLLFQPTTATFHNRDQIIANKTPGWLYHALKCGMAGLRPEDLSDVSEAWS